MMRNKTVLVTGASSGTGLAMAAQLARQGASVLMVSRDPERASAAREVIAWEAAGPPPTVLLADLSSQSDVRKLAARVRAETSRLDVLINNAGAAFRERQLTVDGIERTWATNHLAPFLLTSLLLDLVRAAPAGRIVNVTARLHARAIDFDNLQLERGYGAIRAYALSKACNILFTYELARRLQGTPVTSNCFCPGPTDTNFGHTVGGLMAAMERVVRFVGMLHPAEYGARTGIWLASSPEAANVSGRYFLEGAAARSKAITYQAGVASRLWMVSEELCGLAGSRGIPDLAHVGLAELEVEAAK